MTDTELFLKKFQKELAAGTVSLVLLTVLSRATQPLYGYQIAKLLEGSSEGVIAGKQSALYPHHRTGPRSPARMGRVLERHARFRGSNPH